MAALESESPNQTIELKPRITSTSIIVLTFGTISFMGTAKNRLNQKERQTATGQSKGETTTSISANRHKGKASISSKRAKVSLSRFILQLFHALDPQAKNSRDI